jgi:hypothetical protein
MFTAAGVPPLIAGIRFHAGRAGHFDCSGLGPITVARCDRYRRDVMAGERA